MSHTRRLAAVLAADVAGYSRLMGADEEGTLVLSRVHWVRLELVVEVRYLAWTDDNQLRQVIYQGLREDKPPTEVRRPVPHPKPSS